MSDMKVLPAQSNRDIGGLPLALKVYLFVLCGVDALNYVVMKFCTLVLHLGTPYDRILLPFPGVDLVGYLYMMPKLHTLDFFRAQTFPIYRYPAPLSVLYALFAHLPHAFWIFRVLAWGLFALLGLLLLRPLEMRGVSRGQASLFLLGSGLLCYPIFFEIRQENFEPVVMLLVIAAVWGMFTGRDNFAAVCLGVAAAAKIYPLAYLALFVARKRYAAIAVALLSAAVTTILSLRFMTPSIVVSWHGVGYGLANYNQEFGQWIPLAIGYDHSLFTVVKCILKVVPGAFQHAQLALHLYMGVVALALAAVCLPALKLPFVNQVLFIALACSFLPPSSYDYTLINLLLPWAMLVLVAAENRDRRIAGLVPALIYLALIMGAETEFIIQHVKVGGQIKALLFLPLFGIALKFPFPQPQRLRRTVS